MSNSIGTGSSNGNISNISNQVYWTSSDDIGYPFSTWFVNFEDGYQYLGAVKLPTCKLDRLELRKLDNWLYG